MRWFTRYACCLDLFRAKTKAVSINPTIYSDHSIWLRIFFFYSFKPVCGGDTRDSQLSKVHGFKIVQNARSKLLIKSFTLEREMMCLAECGLDCECFMTVFGQNQCELYRKEAQDYFNITQMDTLSIYYKKDMLNQSLYIVNGKMSFSKCQNSLKLINWGLFKGLQNLWAFDNSVDDSISQCNLTNSTNVFPSVDRFGNANSSMYFNNGYATAPSGVYFNPATGGFTVMVWFKSVNPINSYQKIIDCGNGATTDNIMFGSYTTSSKMYSYVRPVSVSAISNSSVSSNIWAHLAIT